MTSFWDTVDPTTFVDLPAEEVGLAILRWWNVSDDTRLTAGGVFNSFSELRDVPEWRGLNRDRVALVLMEGWTWLLSAGLVMTDPTQSTGSGWVVSTRRGSAVGENIQIDRTVDRVGGGHDETTS